MIDIEAQTVNEMHKAALIATGFWGSAGAGTIPFCRTTKRFLLALRSDKCQQPLTHSGWGGAIDPGETPEETAKREKREETGFAGYFELIGLYTFTSGTFKYHNFISIVDEEFTPVLNWETESAAWYHLEEFPQPLHFGIQAILDDDNAMAILQSLIK
jgi:ADP-ribose pyrophosphatase YjhB (NUDIX family)